MNVAHENNRKLLRELAANERSELGLQIPIICSGDMPFGTWRPAERNLKLKNSSLTYEEQIAMSNIQITGNSAKERLYVLQKELFNKLKNDSSLQTSLMLKKFISDNSQSNIGLLFQAESALSVENTQTAESIINSFQPNNKVEHNYHKYFKWLLKLKKNDNILATERQEMLNMANCCPETDGTVVFAARNMYNNLESKVTDFKSNCNRQPNNRATKKLGIRKDVKVVNDNNIDVNVYPNPSLGEINIALPTIGKWKILAIDIIGRIVWEHECDGCNGVVKHRFVNGKGMYVFKIINEKSGQQSIKKVAIQ